jgi:uncharacterized protein (DUF305 family)
MIALSFLAMYILMYAMVDRLENVYNNVNQFYMAGLMAAPMLVLELVLMAGMYQNKRLNAALIAAGLLAAVIFWCLIRQQGAVTEHQFLRSMIPHHGGAILMCKQLRSNDPKIVRLCGEIKASQKTEIALMKALLADRSSTSAAVE